MLWICSIYLLKSLFLYYLKVNNEISHITIHLKLVFFETDVLKICMYFICSTCFNFNSTCSISLTNNIDTHCNKIHAFVFKYWFIKDFKLLIKSINVSIYNERFLNNWLWNKKMDTQMLKRKSFFNFSLRKRKRIFFFFRTF